MPTLVEQMLAVFDLLADKERLDEWLGTLTEAERDKLYAHRLLKETYGDLLP